jgi:hypothetical protein
MIEKSAGICRTSWSEFLDLNHTGGWRLKIIGRDTLGRRSNAVAGLPSTISAERQP